MEKLGLAWNVVRRAPVIARDPGADLRPAMPLGAALSADMTPELARAEAPVKVEADFA
jgi:hypothetical protein